MQYDSSLSQHSLHRHDLPLQVLSAIVCDRIHVTHALHTPSWHGQSNPQAGRTSFVVMQQKATEYRGGKMVPRLFL